MGGTPEPAKARARRAVGASAGPPQGLLLRCRRPQIDAGDSTDLGDRVIRKAHLLVRAPDRVLVGTVGEAEGATRLHVHMRAQVVAALLGHGLAELGVDANELGFGNVIRRPAALGPVVGVDEVLIAVSPFVRVVDRFRFRPAGGARAGHQASFRAYTRCVYIFVATELVPSPDVAARPREQLQRSADAAYAFLAEHLARPLLGPAPRRMRVFREPAAKGRHREEVRAAILGRGCGG